MNEWIMLEHLINRKKGMVVRSLFKSYQYMGVLGQVETLENHQRKNNMKVKWTTQKSS